MSNQNFSIEIQGDSDGYIFLECPHCESEFKLNCNEFQSHDNEFNELFCPYCGLSANRDNFYTKEVIEQAKQIALNYMYEQLNKSFGNMKKSLNKNKYIKMKFKPINKINIEGIKTDDTVEEVFECKHCNNHVKVLYCSGISKVYCSYCGNDI